MAKTPRLDPYARTIARFYEPLVLLSVMGKTCAERVQAPRGASPMVVTRRRFLQNLAVVCDSNKGGETTTAIAVEDEAACFRFWVATNQDASASVVSFLDDVLTRLRAIGQLPEGGQLLALSKATLARVCFEFAQRRLKKESGLLFRSAQKCRSILEDDPDGSGTANLLAWLRRFEPRRRQDLQDLCLVAYGSRHDEGMRRVRLRAADPEDGSAAGWQALAFRDLRHFIGRLAAHVRAVKELVDDARRVQPLLDVFTVAAVQATACAPRPAADALTSLDGILKRLLKPSDGRQAALAPQLALLDHKLGLEAAVQARYASARFAPRIHAEVRLLDHFHAGQLAFAGDDRFVACSKDACFCCRLYFRHHPARCVEPESHGNLHLNWGLAGLAAGAADARWPEQRALLNAMIGDIREVALRRIEASAPARAPQPDSVSGITLSAATATNDAASSSDRGPSSSGDEGGDGASSEPLRLLLLPDAPAALWRDVRFADAFGSPLSLARSPVRSRRDVPAQLPVELRRGERRAGRGGAVDDDALPPLSWRSVGSLRGTMAVYGWWHERRMW